MATPFNKCKRLVVDLETTGLYASSDSILEAAALLVEHDGIKVLAGKQWKVTPTTEVGEVAARINGYTVEAWVDAINVRQFIVELCAMSQDAIFVAHNAAFDWAFVEAAINTYAPEHAVALAIAGSKVRPMRWLGNYHRCCTVALAIPLVQNGVVASVSLKALAEHFGLEQKNAHTALDDVIVCLRIYRRLMALYAGIGLNSAAA